MAELITELWLREAGFQKHAFSGEPYRHWLLWLGFEDEIGIEIAFGGKRSIATNVPWWFCWLRRGGPHEYSRFIHVRNVRTKSEVIRLIEAIAGRRWNPATHRNGSIVGRF